MVFSVVYDPVEAGLVKDWDKPGTNATGTSIVNEALPTEQKTAVEGQFVMPTSFLEKVTKTIE